MRASISLLLVILSVSCSLTTGSIFAKDLQPGIIGDDDRRVIDDLGPPWAAVGQVNVSGYRRAVRCTGTLIANNLVLTAAHCVMDPWRREPFPLHHIHFLAGVRGSQWLGHSTAKCLHFPPDYAYIGPSKILPNIPFQNAPRHAFTRDLALIVLKDALQNVAPLELDRGEILSQEILLTHASYPADRRHVLTGNFGCHLLKQTDGLWFTDCDTHAASSGGPVLIQSDEDLKLAAIMVGVVSKSASIAVPTSNWIAIGEKRDCP